MLKDSPVEEERKLLPQGNGDWPGFEKVYDRLMGACNHLAASPYTRCGDDHVKLMAVLGCGHEETMKYHVGLALTYGWCK